ncbi:MAG: sodium:solute symporter [Crocinitomicaceae bacterium]
MGTTLIITVIVAYFAVLLGISYLTSRKATNDSFFLGERKSPWYLVSFGMIGASLSGVTFLSVPGWVGNEANQFSYMQAVFGYLIGYFVVAYVLLPLYYRLNLISIYQYLEERFGFWSYKTGASFFLVSRIIGASVRLLLVANVFQLILFDDWGIRFEFTVAISVLLIWIYTSRGGIKTIVWTDTLQTAFMLLSVILTVYFISDILNLSEQGGIVQTVSESKYSQIFFFDDINSNNHFWKHFLGGMFITIGMTGLDQDMMQKNLSCRNLKDAQKNMISMATVLVVVNLVFLSLGALLYIYAESRGITPESSDMLFAEVALSTEAGTTIGVLFLLGLIAAAYSSADSALTSLTTSFSVDFLGVGGKNKTNMEEEEKGDTLDSDMVTNKGRLANRDEEKTRKIVHIVMSAVIILVVIALEKYTTGAAIGLLMKFAGFTYGPLIGMFFFGILTKRSLKDAFIPFIALLSITITGVLWYFSAGAPGANTDGSGVFGNYAFGFELILFNALINFVLLFAASYIFKNNDYEHRIAR